MGHDGGPRGLNRGEGEDKGLATKGRGAKGRRKKGGDGGRMHPYMHAYITYILS